MILIAVNYIFNVIVDVFWNIERKGELYTEMFSSIYLNKPGIEFTVFQHSELFCFMAASLQNNQHDYCTSISF